ncbi:cell division control protein Cdc6, partial [archaeon]|nr:cell division control protein Cdc6 [archaeon]
MSKISTFFENFLKKDSLFTEKEVLLPSYLPDKVLYREEQVQQVAEILAPSLRMEKPSNLFIYGKTGTGKTLSVKHVIESLRNISKTNEIPFSAIYVN